MQAGVNHKNTSSATWFHCHWCAVRVHGGIHCITRIPAESAGNLAYCFLKVWGFSLRLSWRLELLRNTNNRQQELDLKHSVLSAFGSWFLKKAMTIMWSYYGANHNTVTSGERQQNDKDKHKYRDAEAGEWRQLNTLKTGTGENTKDKTLKITHRHKVG